MKGSTFKRCQCPARTNAKGKRLACGKDHGSWYFAVDAGRKDDGTRRLVRRGGFRTQDDAEREMHKVMTAVDDGKFTDDDGLTLTEWLERWLELKQREGKRPSTLRAYRAHVDRYLVPQLGRIRLRDLRTGHVDRLIALLDDGKRSSATVQRIHATLSSALKTAVQKDVLSHNVARKASLPETERPKVKPWEPAELGQFLDAIGGDRLGAMFEVMAYTGLRRGEAIGVRWDDIDLAARTLTVRQQVVQESGRKKNKQAPAPCPYCTAGHVGMSFGKPKTKSGEGRVVELDDQAVGALIAHKLRQDLEREKWGEAYDDHGLVFAREDGNPLRPDNVTKLFGELCATAKVRRVRLHDLRHGHASLMLAANVDPVVVSKRLGHSTIGITVDTYGHLFEGRGRDAAERAGALIPRAPKTEPLVPNQGPCSQSAPNEATENAPADAAGENQQVSGGADGRPCGTRTHNQRIKSSPRDVPPGDGG